MNIPKRNGHYELKIGQNTIVIDIKNGSERMSKLDKIQAGDTSRIGGYKNVTKYYAKVIDAAGNVIDSLPEYYASDESKYVDFISSFIGKENGASVNPNKMLEKLGIKFQQDTGLYLMASKFNGIVKNKIKYTFYVDDWSSKIGGRYDPNEIAAYFEKLGAICKIAEKKKNVRAGECWVASIYLPLDFSLNESKNMKKQLIKLTESDLHRIIRESVKRIIKEDHGLPDSTTAIIYSDIIEDYQAQEIAEEYGISEEQAAAEWFKGVADEMDFAEDDMPTHREFVMNIPELNSKLYHDYGAGYYFLVKNADPSSAPMTMENTIRRAVRGSLNRLIETDCASVMQTGCGKAPKGTNPEAGEYSTAVPFEADKETSDVHGGFSVDGKAKWNKGGNTSVMRRPMYNPKSGKKK